MKVTHETVRHGANDWTRTGTGNVEIRSRLDGQTVAIDHADLDDIVALLVRWNGTNGAGRTAGRKNGNRP